MHMNMLMSGTDLRERQLFQGFGVTYFSAACNNGTKSFQYNSLKLRGQPSENHVFDACLFSAKGRRVTIQDKKIGIETFNPYRCFMIVCYQQFSMIIAEAPPPPLQIPAPPIFPPFCFNTLISVTMTRDPEFPSG
jgi:hypothetical protein